MKTVKKKVLCESWKKVRRLAILEYKSLGILFEDLPVNSVDFFNITREIWDDTI